MKHLGIDYGTKRIGLAISDESGVFAFPKKIIQSDPKISNRENAKNAFVEILELVSAENIQKIVVGNSMDQAGKRNALMDDIDVFCEELSKLAGVPVETQDERFSSMFAKSMDFEKSNHNVANLKQRGKNNLAPNKIDDRAAAIMLQRYLDKGN
ncbi:MAG: Holliday junction resolvase YqgF, putative holliday junction resolvase [Patescibacteria group bacterium]|nr:Holliday junction resolvase YqgF, putative holliday junction resolvase [Patescibacteria group bacterium]